MTGLAIVDLVGVGQGKKGVVHTVGLPVWIDQVVTLGTFRRKAIFIVIGIFSLVVIGPVTINTVQPDRIKPVVCFGSVTEVAVDRFVYPGQWKTRALVDLGNIIHDPGLRRVAAVAGQSYRLIVDIDMAGIAIHPGFIENQRSMARTAIQLPVLSGQTEPGTVVGELGCFGIKLPAFGAVASGTIYF